MRKFSSGATRDSDNGKLNYEAFTHARCKRRFAEFMHSHRRQADGQWRAGDNWQKGMPRATWMESLIRHVEELHYQWDTEEPLSQETVCAIRFNTDGLLLELLLGRDLKEEKDADK